MATLIIYDNEGFILTQQTGEPAPREPVGVPYMWVEIPQGKRLVSVDVTRTPHQPVFEDLPKSEIDVLREQLEATQQAVDFLLMGGM